MSAGVGGKEPVSRDNYTAVMADRGQSALQETPESQSGTEVPGADPACLEEPSEHGPAARREEESAGPPSADQGAAVATGRHIAGPQGDGPSQGDGGGQRAAEEGHAVAAEEGDAAAAGEGDAAAAAGADREEKAEEPESDDAQQTDNEAQIDLEAQKQVSRRYQTPHELRSSPFASGACTICTSCQPSGTVIQKPCSQMPECVCKSGTRGLSCEEWVQCVNTHSV